MSKREEILDAILDALETAFDVMVPVVGFAIALGASAILHYVAFNPLFQ